MTSFAATFLVLHQVATQHVSTPANAVSISHVQAIVLGLLQGVAELFPISSLGHTVIAPKLLGWNIDQKSDAFLPFVVTLHLGTAIALIVYYRKLWLTILTPMFASIKRGSMGDSPEERLGWLVFTATIPAAIVAVFLEKAVRSLFANPEVAALFLIVNGFILYFGERLRLRAGARVTAIRAGDEPQDGRAPRPLSTLSWTEAIVIGASQILAFLPGISRSGVTMVAGLATGLTHEAALRFSFLLATPIIFAAGIAEVPALFDATGRPVLGDAILGGVVAGFAAYASVKFLTRYFDEARSRLDPFAYYCWAAGGLAFIGLLIRG